jgi:hypothetical protein
MEQRRSGKYNAFLFLFLCAVFLCREIEVGWTLVPIVAIDLLIGVGLWYAKEWARWLAAPILGLNFVLWGISQLIPMRDPFLLILIAMLSVFIIVVFKRRFVPEEIRSLFRRQNAFDRVFWQVIASAGIGIILAIASIYWWTRYQTRRSVMPMTMPGGISQSLRLGQ